MGNSEAACPRCGAKMQQRLDEYECTACGHFQGLRLSSGSVSRVVNQGKKQRSFDSSAEAVEAAARLPKINHRHVEILYMQRRLFVGIFSIAFFAVNYVAFSRAGNEPISSSNLIRISIATLFWGGLSAIVLYVDWLPLKKIALGLLALSLIWLGYDAITATAPGENLRQIAACCSFALLLWFSAILYFDIRLHS